MDYGTINKQNDNLCLDMHLKYQALYEGGELFRRNIECFLDRNPLELAEVYNLRKKQARYRSYVGPIVNFFGAQLFASPYSIRTIDVAGSDAVSVWNSVYHAFKESCDADGNDLTSFVAARFAQSLIHRVALVVVERATDPSGNVIPRLRAVAWDAIRDWGTAPDGSLAWICVRSCVRTRDKLTRKDVITETWTLYDAATIDTYAISYTEATKPTDTTLVPLVSSVPHGFARLPVVPLELPAGLWLLSTCADAQIEHFQLSAGLGWVIRRNCYPTLVHKRKQTNDDKECGPRPTGPGVVQTIDIGEELSYVSPDGAPFEVLRTIITDAKNEIYRVAHQMANSIDQGSTALGRSAESKYADQSATETCLRAYGDIIKEFLEHVFDLVAEVLSDTASRFSIEGFANFRLEDAGTLFDMLERAKKLGMLEENDVLRTELYRRAITLLLPDVNSQLREKAVELAGKAKTTPQPPPPQPAPEDDSGADQEDDET